jgi:hypothetical protein
LGASALNEVNASPGAAIPIDMLIARHNLPQRLKNEFRPGFCLDVYNGGAENNGILLGSCANVSGQVWTATVDKTRNTWFRLTTAFRGPDMCLDVISGGSRDNQTELRRCGNVPSQLWRSVSAGGQVKLINLSRGPGMCLDVVNDDGYPDNNYAKMASCGGYSGQFWAPENWTP